MIALVVAAIAAAIGAASSRGRRDVWEQLFRDWRRLVRKHVREPQERATVLALIDAQRQVVDELFADTTEDVVALAEVHRDYEAGLPDYLRVVDRLADSLLTAQIELLEVGVTIEETLGPETLAKVQADLRKRARKREAKLDRR